jgi:hypothetical protein
LKSYKFGDRVNATKALERRIDHQSDKNVYSWKELKIVVPIQAGLFLGYRYLRNGYRYHCFHDSNITVTKTIKVALVAPDSIRNPMYVLIENLQKCTDAAPDKEES